MPAKTREIKGRIKAVANIQRITRTMQMIATAKFQSAFRAATAAQPYARKISELVGELAAEGESLSHPLLRGVATEGPESKQLLLVITSNRGMCGGYNANVVRTAMHFRRENGELDVEVVGKKGNGYFRFNQVPVHAFHGHFTDTPTYEQVEELADGYMASVAAGDCSGIHVAYMAFHSMGRQTPKVLKLLPLDNPASEASPPSRAEVQYDFSPDPRQLLDELLPVMVKARLFQCFNEAVVAEQIARMVAMKAATDAASKMGKFLTRQFNRARQATITTELTEIMGGAAGLE